MSRNADYYLRHLKPAGPHSNRRGGYRINSFLRSSDRSGKIYDAEDTRREWNGLIVGRDEWEIRHPQQFVRGIRHKIASPNPRPVGPDGKDLALGIANLVPVNGSVVGGSFVSSAITPARPFVFWTLPIVPADRVEYITLIGLQFSPAAPPEVARGVFLGFSTDGVNFTNEDFAVGEFGGGITSPRDYGERIGETAAFVRLAMIEGGGSSYSGVLSHTGITVEVER